MKKSSILVSEHRASPKEVKKLEEIQEILTELHLNSSITNIFRVVFHYFNTAEYRKGV